MTPTGVATVVIGGLGGAATGLVLGRVRISASTLAGLGSGVVVLAALGALWGERPALVAAVSAVAVAAIIRTPGSARSARDGETRRRFGRMIPGAVLLVAIGLTAWTGANDPGLSWFGAVASHGRRRSNEVAITFDDGPNATATMAVRDILDRYGVKATFFLVGRALDERPEVARALLADGQLLGNHSYHHDQWRWLDPRYPELGRTQDAFARRLGVCPRFYRPPHGERTPFVSAAVSGRGMRMVTWDVSAGDWATRNAELVARRVLDHVRAGSIVLLHDGLDGQVDADRSVVVAALPLILDGLRARALQPVRLDVLLGGSGYLTGC